MPQDAPIPIKAAGSAYGDTPAIDVDEVLARIDDMIEDAISFDTGERQDDREMALAYVDGEMPDMVSKEGKSQAVEEILADSLAWLLPNIARIFQSSDNIASFGPALPRIRPGTPPTKLQDDYRRVQDFARQATNYINDRFLKDCNGEKVLRDGFYNGFLHGNGVLKHYWDPTPKCEIQRYTGLSEKQYLDITNDPDVEVLEHSAEPDFEALARSTAPAALAAPGLGGAGDPGALPPGPGLPGLPNGPLPPGLPPGMVPQPVQQQQALGAGAAMPFAGGPPAPPPEALGGLMALLQPDNDALPPGANFAPPPVPLQHDLTVRVTTSHGRIVVKAVPDEDFYIESEATALNEDECRFVAHRNNPTRSDLIKQGIDPDQVWDLGEDSDDNETENIRRGSNAMRGGSRGIEDYQDKAGQRVEVWECYAQLDLDGDGITEWYQVKAGGRMGAREILIKVGGEPCVVPWGGMLPFTDLVPDPVPHRWKGRSLYKRLRQPQRIGTALSRRVNDNIYQTVEPMRAVDLEKVRNKDSVFNPKLGQVVITEGDPSTIIRDLAVPFVAKEAIPLIEEQRKVAERRVGVGEQSAGLDPDAMQGQVATSITAMQTASSLRKEDYARCLNVGMQRLFKALLHLAVENQDRPTAILVRDQWEEVDPRGWSAEMDVNVNTGLGAGNRDRDLTMLQGIASAQKELLLQLVPMLGIDNAVMSLSNLFVTYRMACEAAGIKNPEQFFPDLSPEVLAQAQAEVTKKQQEQAQNDPMLKMQQQKQAESQAKAEAQAQENAFKLQLQQQQQTAELQLQQQMQTAELQHKQALAEAEFTAKQQLEQAKMMAELQKEQLRAQNDIALQRERSTLEIAAAREKATAEIELERAKAAAKIELERETAEHKAALAARELEIEAKLKLIQIAQEGRASGETEVRKPE